jgi:hypothetical protein
MANSKTAIKSTGKTTGSTVAKPRAAKQESIVSSSVSSFMNQATYNQRVQEKAYELYLQRGGVQGDALADWLKAEKIISSQSK